METITNMPDFAATSRAHPLIQLLEPQNKEHILDLGCGDGALGHEIAHHGALVLGLDWDAEALIKAAARGIETLHLDANEIEFENEFDAIFTNAMLNWLNPIETVVPKLFKSLKPGGRLVGEFGGHGNISSIRVALKHSFKQVGLRFEDFDPWDHPLTDDFCGYLQAAGFDIKYVDTFPRYTPLPLGLEEWMRENLANVFDRLPQAIQTEEIINETVELLRGITSTGEQHWIADFVRIRFSATKPL